MEIINHKKYFYKLGILKYKKNVGNIFSTFIIGL